MPTPAGRTDDVVQFSWTFRRGGYHWVLIKPPRETDRRRWFSGRDEWERQALQELRRAEKAPVRCLTDGVPSGAGGSEAKRYSPFRTPDLFRRFAATEPTENGILDFANRYGLLLGRFAPLWDPGERDDLGKPMLIHGEPMGFWRDEIQAMRQAVQLFDLLARRDVEGLRRVIHWPDRRVVEYRSVPDSIGQVTRERITARTRELAIYPELLPLFRYGNVEKPGWYYVQRLVNRHLEGTVSPRLLFDAQAKEIGVFTVPHHLLGALWLQLARSLEGTRDYRRCICGRWFRVGLGIARSDKRSCGSGCRVRAFRKSAGKGRSCQGRSPRGR